MRFIGKQKADIMDKDFTSSSPDGAGVPESLEAKCSQVDAALDSLHDALTSSVSSSAPLSEADYLAVACMVYNARRKIDEIMPMPGFASTPALDHVLDLYIKTRSGEKVTISSACAGIACPHSTALRWIQAMESLGLVQRQIVPGNPSSHLLSLTPDGIEKVEKSLQHYAGRSAAGTT